MKLSKEEIRGKRIDCHTHCGMMLSSFYDDKIPNGQNLVGLLENTINSSIEKLITFPFPDNFIGNNLLEKENDNDAVRLIFEKIPYKLQNDRLLLEVDRFAKGRVLPFLMFSTKYAIDEQLEYLNEIIAKYDVYGMKYYPDADGMDFSDFEVHGHRFIDFLIEHNLPMTVHTSAENVVSKRGVSNPMEILKLAKKYPELRVCIAHMAHFSKEVFGELEKSELTNLYIDTSPFLHLCNIRNICKSERCLDLPYSKPVDVLKTMINRYGKHVIWGSDFPFNYTCNLKNEMHDFDYEKYSYTKYMELLNKLSSEMINLITSDNTLRFLFGDD